MQWECEVFLVSVNDVGQTFVGASFSCNLTGKMLTFLCAQSEDGEAAPVWS